MATVGLNVTREAQNIVVELGLVDGTNYSMQNIGGEFVYIAESAAEPVSGFEFWKIVGLRELITIQPEAGEGIWVIVGNSSGRVSITEAP